MGCGSSATVYTEYSDTSRSVDPSSTYASYVDQEDSELEIQRAPVHFVSENPPKVSCHNQKVVRKMNSKGRLTKLTVTMAYDGSCMEVERIDNLSITSSFLGDQLDDTRKNITPSVSVTETRHLSLENVRPYSESHYPGKIDIVPTFKRENSNVEMLKHELSNTENNNDAQSTTDEIQTTTHAKGGDKEKNIHSDAPNENEFSRNDLLPWHRNHSRNQGGLDILVAPVVIDTFTLGDSQHLAFDENSSEQMLSQKTKVNKLIHNNHNIHLGLWENNVNGNDVHCTSQSESLANANHQPPTAAPSENTTNNGNASNYIYGTQESKEVMPLKTLELGPSE